MIEEPIFMYHYGTCDMCKRRLTLVAHFGYNTQPERDYRICMRCLGQCTLLPAQAEMEIMEKEIRED